MIRRKTATKLNQLGQLVPIEETKEVDNAVLPIVFNDPKMLSLFFINGALNEGGVKRFVEEEKYKKLRKLIGKREVKSLLNGDSDLIPDDYKRKQRKLLGRLYLYANYQALFFKKKFKKKKNKNSKKKIKKIGMFWD